MIASMAGSVRWAPPRAAPAPSLAAAAAPPARVPARAAAAARPPRPAPAAATPAPTAPRARGPAPPASRPGVRAHFKSGDDDDPPGKSPQGPGAEAAPAQTAPRPATPQLSPAFKRARLVVFAGIMLGYGSFYLTRNSLPFVAPVMEADPALGINLAKVGLLASAFPVAYAFSKLVAGVLGDRLRPSTMLAVGLLATAAANAGFAAGSGLPWFAAFWILNGLLQGTGAPACARLLTRWFHSAERGTWWGIWTTSNNLGAFLAPVIAGTAAKMFGWRWGFLVPAAIAVLMSGAVYALVKDSPEDAGFEPVEPAAPPAPKDGAGDGPAAAAAPGELGSPASTVFRNPVMWAFAVQYFFVYVVRAGATTWLVFYLLKAKGLGDAATAAMRVSGLELGGLAGSLASGKLSDWMIANRAPGDGVVGKRVQIMMACSVGMAAALGSFAALPATASVAQWASVFMVGFFLYGPQMLTGLAAAEVAGPSAVGASQGLIGLISYMGAAAAGMPLSLAVSRYGWEVFFAAMVASCGMIFVLLAPLWNQPSFAQAAEQRAA